MRTSFTPSEMAMIESKLFLYFRIENGFFLRGKSTRLDIILMGTFAKEAATEPTAREWASWKWARRQRYRLIAKANRNIASKSNSLLILKGKTGRPPSRALK
jgi:hypothetical protein